MVKLHNSYSISNFKVFQEQKQFFLGKRLSYTVSAALSLSLSLSLSHTALFSSWREYFPDQLDWRPVVPCLPSSGELAFCSQQLQFFTCQCFYTLDKEDILAPSTQALHYVNDISNFVCQCQRPNIKVTKAICQGQTQNSSVMLSTRLNWILSHDCKGCSSTVKWHVCVFGFFKKCLKVWLKSASSVYAIII